MKKFKVSVIRTQEQIITLELEAENASALKEILENKDFTEFDDKFDEGQIVHVYHDVRAIKSVK